jgi:uncharacterized protein (TIGR03435 family)
MRLMKVAVLVLAAGTLALAQRPAFDVASVKVNTANGSIDGATPHRSGDLVMFHNTQPYSLIFYAYHLTANYQIAGYTPLPEPWNWYDVDARTGGAATDDEVRLMMQSLLEDRFKLKIHRETRDMPVYELAIAKDKATLTPSREGAMKAIAIEGTSYPPPAVGICVAGSWNDGTHVICHGAGMDKIVAVLSNQLKAPVVDRTALTGTYDLHVRFDPRTNPNTDPGPSLGEAIQQELGLTLQKGTGPVEVIVIDHMEKPSEN